MMLFLFWQVISCLLYLLAHNHSHEATQEGAFRTFTLLRVGDVAFFAGIVLAYQLYGTLEFQPICSPRPPNRLSCSHFGLASRSEERQWSHCSCSSEP